MAQRTNSIFLAINPMIQWYGAVDGPLAIACRGKETGIAAVIRSTPWTLLRTQSSGSDRYMPI